MNNKKKEEKLLYILRYYQLHKGQKITYSFFKQIYQKVKAELTEAEFSELLGIKPVGYKGLLEINPIIDKTDTYLKISEEEKEQLLMKLIKDYDLYKGQKITLSLFEKMYESEGTKLTKVEFANLLGIEKKTYLNLKWRNKQNENFKIVILMNRKLNVEEEQRKLLEIVQLYNLHKGQKIDYIFCEKLYKEFKTELTQTEFANLLGISSQNLRNSRNTKEKVRLFRNMQLNAETIEEIRKGIIHKYEGKSIYYMQNIQNKGDVDFLELYRPYRIYFTENEFAELLGISEKNIWYTKRNQANPIIRDTEKVKKVEELKKEIIEGRYYSKIEIENLCKKFNLSLNDFITYYINNGKFFDYSEYEKAINHNQRLWIGKTKIADSDLEKYNEMYNRIVKTVINNVNQKYREYYLEEDMKSNMLIFIIYQCGDLVRNFKYDENLMERMIWVRVRIYCQNEYIKELKKDIKKVKLEENRIKSEESSFDYEEEIDISIDENKMNEEKLIALFKNYLSQGYDKETIMENISNTFHIEKIEMLEMMKKYLLEKGRVVQNKNGEYEIGEQ